MANPKANEDPKLGDVQAPQDGSTDQSLDTPVSDQPTADAAAAPAPENSDHQEDNNPEASKKPGEAKGAKKKEQVAAEQDPASAEETNPVAEATGNESKDPYAEGKHIDNPEPNNGAANRPEDAEQPGTPAHQAAANAPSNSDAEEQNEVAEGRTEPDGTDTETDPLAATANEKAA